MPKSLLDALIRLAQAHGYRDPRMILAENAGRERSSQPVWWRRES